MCIVTLGMSRCHAQSTTSDACVFGNSTKNNSLYSPDPIGSVLVTVIRTFLSVDIYMMKVPYMFAFL